LKNVLEDEHFHLIAAGPWLSFFLIFNLLDVTLEFFSLFC